ncbi:LysM peptidoglycan-binding domain-containing protein [Candidatus Fermentibacteria bacterium]|nr:LysM peptidoglycan-binding domain-containing protein [Candidatus Fermentibacteria bacterium]
MRSQFMLLLLVPVVLVAAVTTAQEQNEYEIGYGDTLWDLSIRFYGSPEYWQDILLANPELDGPGSLQPGQRIVIPAISGVSSPTSVHTYESSSVFVPTQAANVAMLSRLRIESAGWIAASPLVPEGRVVLVDIEEREEFSNEEAMMGDLIELDIGSNDGVGVGQIFHVLKEGGLVDHPQTGESMGRLIRVAGVCRVLRTEAETSVAKLEHCYITVEAGDPVVGYEAASDIYINPQPVSSDLDAWVVAIKDPDRSSAFSFDIVYLDKGSQDNVSPGDMFAAYKSGSMAVTPAGEDVRTSDVEIAEVVILATKSSTSAAIVSSNVSTDLVEVGDRLRLVRRSS